MPSPSPIQVEELSQYFNMPEKAVAKKLGICLTSLKKICRQNGITRWPYRKVGDLVAKLAEHSIRGVFWGPVSSGVCRAAFELSGV